MNRKSPAVIVLPRRERQRLDRRRSILEAAETVFAREGFHAASMEQVAKAAEYAVGSVYLYFKSKEELYAVLFEEKIRAMLASVQRRAGGAKDPVEAMRQAVLGQLEYCEQNRGFFRIFLSTDMRLAVESKGDSWRDIRTLYREFLSVVAKGIERGQRSGVFRAGPPMNYARALLGMINALARVEIEQETGNPLLELADFIVELALRGIVK